MNVFNPNTDNAFIMGGFEKQANSIWLLHWRRILQRSKETNGLVLQTLVDDASNMQQAEADMAYDKGVAVVELVLRQLSGDLNRQRTKRRCSCASLRKVFGLVKVANDSAQAHTQQAKLN